MNGKKIVLRTGKDCKLNGTVPGCRTGSGDSDKDATATPKGKEQKKQWAGKRKKEIELERSGCWKVVSLLKPQASESQLLPEVLRKKGPHLCLVSTVKSWALEKAKLAKSKLGSFCEKRRDVINQIANLLAKTSKDNSDLKK